DEIRRVFRIIETTRHIERNRLAFMLSLYAVRNGKTGFRASNTLPAAAFIYDLICERNPNYTGEDYILLPQYKNRNTASQIIQRQFREVMRRAGVEKDPITGKNTAFIPCDIPRSARGSFVRRSGQYFQSGQKRRHISRSDRALLCSPSAP